MKSQVAVVGARPETVLADYVRLLELLGADAAELRAARPLLCVEALAWPPAAGAGTPPWQLDGVLAWLGGGIDAPVWPVAVGRGAGAQRARDGYGWRHVLAARAAELVDVASPTAANWPTELIDRPALMLTAARTDAATSVGGAVALGWFDLGDRPTAATRRRRAAILADRLELRMKHHPRIVAVTDGAVVGLGPSPADLRPAATQVLLASADPVALDATVAHWCGWRPQSIAHLQACAERGLGRTDPRQIHLVGEVALLDRPPGAADDGRGLDLAAAVGESLGERLGRRLATTRLAPLGLTIRALSAIVTAASWRRRARWRRFSTTAWGRLWSDYRSGAVARERAA